MARSLHRRAAALIAAYAIALQAVLGFGLALPSHAASIAELCVGLDENNAPAVPVHDAGAPCCLAMGCHGGPAIAPQDATVELARLAQDASGAATSAPIDAPLAIERSSWPRGPPRA